MNFDYQHKLTFSINNPFDVNYVNRFCQKYPSDKVLVEIENTKGITSLQLENLNPKVAIRIAGGYTKERIKNKGNITFENVSFSYSGNKEKLSLLDVNLKINSDNLNKLKDIILNNNIEVIFARRVFPELYGTGGIELIDSLCDMFNNCNIQYIVIEGRRPVRNAKNPLNTLDEEIKHFSKFYVQHKKYKNCCILKRK